MAKISQSVYIVIALVLGILVGCAPARSLSSPVAIPSVAPNATPATAQTPVAPAPTVAATNIPISSETIRLIIVPGKSEARYRVREQLAQVPLPSDAIGKTQDITGTIVGKTDGTIVPADSKFVVNLNTLESDQDRRDNFLRRNVLQTDRYPNAVFVPTQTEGLPLQIPPTGPVNFKLLGDLTIRNVTKPVTWDVKCDPQGNQGTCTATTNFTFEYMGLQQPQVPVVLSVQNSITLEVDLTLQNAS